MVNLRNWADAAEVADDALMTLWNNWRLHSHDTRTLRAYAFQTVRHRLLRAVPRLRRERQLSAPLGWGTDDLDDDPARRCRVPAATATTTPMPLRDGWSGGCMWRLAQKRLSDSRAARDCVSRSVEADSAAGISDLGCLPR